MRSPPLLVALLVVAASLAGCAARGGEDPFAYLQKPLYADSFHLEQARDEPVTRQFWVTDGSIAQIQVQVWVNATAGMGRVVIKDPSGAVALDTTSSTTQRFGLNLGSWTVTVSGSDDVAGNLGVRVTRV